MPAQLVINRCPEIAALFAGGMDELLHALADAGATRAAAALGQGPERSSPGSPPNTQTGELLASIHADGASMVADGGHATFLELGTRKMAARPWFMQAALDVQADVEGVARKALGL